VDAFLRRRRLLLRPFLRGRAAFALASACVAAACGAPSGALVGSSDRPAGGAIPKGTRDGGAIDGAPALPADYRTSFTKVNKARFVSSGHASGRWDVEVYANEPALRALATRTREAPVGAIVVEEHFEKSSAGTQKGPVMVMEKRAKGFAPEHGDWRYTVVGAAGQLVKDGVVDSCAGCHDDAPADGFFPILD
jgi:hypothetical protein